MALVVGTDTYISQADASTYVTEHYATTEIKAVAWNALTSDNKDAYLRKATQTIDRQPLVGIKALTTQTLEFPRAIYTTVSSYGVNTNALLYGDNWYVQSAVPSAVTSAQVEIALALAAGISKRVDLQRQGVKSFSVGNLSESYGGGKLNALPYEAKELLQPYIAGGVPIC